MAVKNKPGKLGYEVAVDERKDKAELEMAAREAVNNLPQMYRQVLILRYYNDMSYKQIKSVLGISIHSVKGRLARAKKKIAEY